MTYDVKDYIDFGSYIDKNKDFANIIILKSKFLLNLRNSLNNKSTIELEMPCLQKFREGAPVHQFVTKHPLTKEKYYLRHCMEDHLQRSCSIYPYVYELAKFKPQVQLLLNIKSDK